ncbi:MAG: CotH kinase family protein, partial [Candidatus Promineifilaceae bacterium]
ENDLQASYGDSTHWDHLIEYVAAHDLTAEDAYLYVQTQVNLDNFIDYALIQIITANADWPHNNQLKFRDRANGSWHWMFWDSDFAFGLMTDSYIEKNMFTHILDHEDELQQQSSLLLRKLLENPDFKTRFLNRLADLLNTVFAADNVLPEIDRLAGSLEQDIPFEIRRWPGSGDWDAGVEYMREFARRRPDIVRSQTLEAFDLPGTATLTINQLDNGGFQSPIPNPKSQIIINGGTPLSSQELPWQGEYFQGVNIQLTAVPAPGYRFVEWACAASLTAADATCPDLPPNPEVTLSLDGDLSLTPRFEHEN